MQSSFSTPLRLPIPSSYPASFPLIHAGRDEPRQGMLLRVATKRGVPLGRGYTELNLTGGRTAWDGWTLYR
jgi:hypothetical protein